MCLSISILVLMTSVIFFAHAVFINHEFSIKSQLLDTSRYNPTIRPVRNHRENIVIRMSWNLIVLNDVSEKENSISQASSIELTWYDEFLVWNKTDYNDLDHFFVKGSEIWTPAIKIVNKIDGDFEERLDSVLFRVESDGKVFGMPSGIIQSMCKINPQNFPFDCHECYILFTTAVLPMHGILFALVDPSILETEIIEEHSVWSIKRKSNATNNIPGFGSVYLVYNLKRKHLYYTFNIIMPSSLLSILSLATYLIPINEGEKIGCAMTIFLTYIVFQNQVSDMLPESSHSISTIGIYFMMQMLSSCLILLDSVFVYKLSDNDANTKQEIPEKALQENAKWVSVWKKKFPRKSRLIKILHGIFGFLTIGLVISGNLVMFISTTVSNRCDT